MDGTASIGYKTARRHRPAGPIGLSRPSRQFGTPVLNFTAQSPSPGVVLGRRDAADDDACRLRRACAPKPPAQP